MHMDAHGCIKDAHGCIKEADGCIKDGVVTVRRGGQSERGERQEAHPEEQHQDRVVVLWHAPLGGWCTPWYGEMGDRENKWRLDNGIDESWKNWTREKAREKGKYWPHQEECPSPRGDQSHACVLAQDPGQRERGRVTETEKETERDREKVTLTNQLRDEKRANIKIMPYST
jgi:hypothetical protein